MFCFYQYLTLTPQKVLGNWPGVIFCIFLFFARWERAGVDPSAPASWPGWLAAPAAAGRGCANWCSPCKDWCQEPSQKVSFIHFTNLSDCVPLPCSESFMVLYQTIKISIVFLQLAYFLFSVIFHQSVSVQNQCYRCLNVKFKSSRYAWKTCSKKI